MKAHRLTSIKHSLSKLKKAHIPGSPGIFILYRTNMGAPSYIGRADSSLIEILRGFANSKEGYKYFKYMACQNASDAFQWESIFWHKGQASIDNSEANGGKHPKRPKHSAMECPFPGCTHEFPEFIPPPSEEFAGSELEPMMVTESETMMEQENITDQDPRSGE